MPQIELSLRDYLRIFRKRRMLIILTFLVAVVGSYAYISMQPSSYETSTTIKIVERKTVAGLLTEWLVYTPADMMESQAKVITGYPIIKQVALRLKMIDVNDAEVDVRRVVSSLQASVTTERITTTNIIRITASADTPMLAMNIANTVAEVYVDENLREKKAQVTSTRVFIEEQLAQLVERLTEGEEKLKALGKKSEDVKFAEPMQEKLLSLEFELTAALQKYTEKHPKILRIKEQISELERQLDSLAGDDLEYARLAREVEVNRKLYAMLKEKFEEARITEAQKVGDASIVDPAPLPATPIGPSKKVGIIIGAIMGIAIGVGLAFITETLDTSIGTIEDVEALLKVPVIGVIPSAFDYLEKRRGVIGSVFGKFFKSHTTEKDEKYVRLIVHHKPTLPISEAFRTVRTNLKITPEQKTILITSAEPGEGKTALIINLGLTIAQKGLKTVIVSSDLRRPAVAKTFGISREPGLSDVISGTADIDSALRSLSDIMLGDIELGDVMKTPGMENISIMPSGYLPKNPSELFEYEGFDKLVTELKKRFDVVLFDSPPALPITDASLLARKVDMVVLCYEIGRASRNALARTKSQLDAIGAHIVGVVLNHITSQVSAMEPYPYYYKYHYKYKLDEKEIKGAKKKH